MMTYNKGDLEQTAELLLLASSRLGVNETTLVAEGAIASDEDVAGNGLPEDLDLEDISDDFLGLSVNVRVDEGHIVVAGNDVTEGRQTLLDSLDRDGGGQGVSDVLQLLIGGRVGKKKTVSVAWNGKRSKGCSGVRPRSREIGPKNRRGTIEQSLEAELGSRQKQREPARRVKQIRTGTKSANDPGATDGGLDDGNNVLL